MEIKKTLRLYHKAIIVAGFIAGAVATLDATKIYDLGIAEMHWFVHLILFIAIGIGGYTYYDIFWNIKFREKTKSPSASTEGPASQGEAKTLEDLGDSREMEQMK